jgi:hypothetical protein
VSWAGEAVAAIRKIVLIEDRVAQLADRVDRLASSYSELDRRMLKIEAKFELIERLNASVQRSPRPKKKPQLMLLPEEEEK